ncbi:release factor [Trichodelitschia bisporula]|uniref:Release factor n=1 Tax=Trichodelitschia bisporula TaxID=703511 RepID=A0A6G1I732_9PEZI|nr:release factor [Trichodelitschia bisporula]
MFYTPWICTRCLVRTTRRLGGRQLRWHSSAAPTLASTSTSKPIYPALLERARAISKEHASLSQQLAENFDTKTAKKAGELATVVDALKQWEAANDAYTELSTLIHDSKTDPELLALASDDLPSTTTALESATATLTQTLVPKHPFASFPCLIEIRPGAGGGEASIFAADLLRMYTAYCAAHNLRAQLVKRETADGVEDMITEAILEVETPGAYAVLRGEAGVHRVQRVPATETKGRTHTSSAAVMVLPSFPANDEAGELGFEDPGSDYYIDPKEVRLDVMRASGAGGQHVNKTESAVRLVHLPTNTVVFIQESRSQLRNREQAWQLLRARIAAQRREAREEELLKMRRGVVGVARIGRGDKIRTYNWQQQRITDHRSGLTVHGIEGVMAGGPNLEKIMQSVRVWLAEREMEDLIATESGK